MPMAQLSPTVVAGWIRPSRCLLLVGLHLGILVPRDLALHGCKMEDEIRALD